MEVVKKVAAKIRTGKIACSNYRNGLRQVPPLLWVLVGLTILPWWTQGIMCNDQLQNRLASMNGTGYFLQNYISNEILPKGRIIAAWCKPLVTYLEFLGSNNITYRIVPIASILLVGVLFVKLLRKWHFSKAIATVCGLVFLVALPITFEHTVPQTFNTMYNFSVVLLILSLGWYTDYVRTGNKKKLWITLVSIFLICTSYELFITYIPLYWFLCVWENGSPFKSSKTRNALLYLAGTGVAFLVAYKLSLEIYPTAYSGTKIGGISLAAVIPVLWTLFKNAIPGCWLFSEKYQYIIAPLLKNLSLTDIARAAGCAGVFCALLISNLKRANRTQKSALCEEERDCKNGHAKSENLKLHLQVIGVALLYMILPSLPMGLSQMYQGNDFLALPVSFFLYIPACLIIAILLCDFVGFLKSNGMGIKVIACAASVFIFAIQIMNSAIANQQNADAKRLVAIEKFLSMDYITSGLNLSTIYSPDIFETRYTLAIHDGYFTDYMKQIWGSNLQIVNLRKPEDALQQGEANLYLDAEGFYLSNGECVLYASPVQRDGEKYIVVDQNQSLLGSLDHCVYDSGYYLYGYRRQDAALTEISLDQLSGRMRNETLFVTGGDWYSDGWMGETLQLECDRTQTGKLTFSATNVNNKPVTLNWCAGEEKDTITIPAGETITFSIPLIEEMTEIQIKASPTMENNNADARTLTVLLQLEE